MAELGRILLVEDDPKDVELTMSALEEIRLANEVFVLHDGAEALDYLLRRGPYAGRSQIEPAVVLLDLKLPKIDGLEVLRQMRTYDELREIPVVILTSSREEQDLAAGYRLGTNAYVVKPVVYADFIAAVKEVGLFWAVVNEAPPLAAKESPN